MDKLDIARNETLKLKSARGKDYYRILDNIAANVKDDFVADVEAIRILHEDNRVTLFHIGCLMIRYELNCAATIHLLEKFCGAPSGTYESLKDRGLKVGEMLESVMNSPDRFDMPFELVSRYDMREWCDWSDDRLRDGLRIEVKLANGIEIGTYWNNGVAGLVEWDDGGFMETEEYGGETKWREAK